MILFGCFLLLIALFGAPLFSVIAASTLLGFYQLEVDLSVIAIEIYRIVDTPVLVAIPLFTFAGYLLSESGASKRLVKLTDALIGNVPSGLAVVSLAACAFFTALTGASGVTIIALGALLYPALKQAGYTQRFSLGLLTSSGSLGMILDIFSAIIIIVPLILPIAVGYGIHPIHLGIIFLANMQIGYFTPPVGMNLFIASYRFRKPITELYIATIPFMLVLFVAVLIITYWPALSLGLLQK